MVQNETKTFVSQDQNIKTESRELHHCTISPRLFVNFIQWKKHYNTDGENMSRTQWQKNRLVSEQEEEQIDIRQIDGKYTEYKKTLHNNFNDFKRAFDCVWQQGL